MSCETCKYKTEEKRHEPVPYLAYESAMARNERTVKRLIAVIVVMVLLLAGTITGFLVYLSQYDFTGADITIDAADGHANYIGQDGDISNGTYYGAETVSNIEEPLPVEGNGGSEN